jgi:hypothetical protein
MTEADGRRYQAWLASPSISTPDGDEMIIAFKLAKRLGEEPTDVLRALRGQRGQNAYLKGRIEQAVERDPSITFVRDGRVRRTAFV